MTRTIVFEHPVPQEGEQLENINHVIRALMSPVLIDWRDDHTVEVSLMKVTYKPDGSYHLD